MDFEFVVDGTDSSKLWHPKTGRKILASVTHDVPQVAFTEYEGPMATPSSFELDASAPVVEVRRTDIFIGGKKPKPIPKNKSKPLETAVNRLDD